MRLHHRWAISEASHREPPHPSPLPNLNSPIEKGPLQRWWSLGFLSCVLPACCTHDSSFGVQIFCALQNAKLRQPAREYSTSGHAHFAQRARSLTHHTTSVHRLRFHGQRTLYARIGGAGARLTSPESFPYVSYWPPRNDSAPGCLIECVCCEGEGRGEEGRGWRGVVRSRMA